MSDDTINGPYDVDGWIGAIKRGEADDAFDDARGMVQLLISLYRVNISFQTTKSPMARMEMIRLMNAIDASMRRHRRES